MRNFFLSLITDGNWVLKLRGHVSLNLFYVQCCKILLRIIGGQLQWGKLLVLVGKRLNITELVLYKRNNSVLIIKNNQYRSLLFLYILYSFHIQASLLSSQLYLSAPRLIWILSCDLHWRKHTWFFTDSFHYLFLLYCNKVSKQ